MERHVAVIAGGSSAMLHGGDVEARECYRTVLRVEVIPTPEQAGLWLAVDGHNLCWHEQYVVLRAVLSREDPARATEK